ncbi:MAG: hypothetical protein ACE5K7_04900 [Phycisphaerae bacterium]
MLASGNDMAVEAGWRRGVEGGRGVRTAGAGLIEGPARGVAAMMDRLGRSRMMTVVSIIEVLVVAGCQGGLGAGQSGSERLRPSRRPHVADVPVPEGFELVDKLSEDHATAGWRFIRHVYRGRADRLAVRSFYREQMPLSNWSYISDQNIQGEYTLLFEKPDEQCEVKIWPSRTAGLVAGSLVRVVIRPLRRGGELQKGKAQR